MPGKAFRGTDFDDDDAEQGDKTFEPFIYFVIAGGSLTILGLCGLGLYRFCQNPAPYLARVKQIPTAAFACCFRQRQSSGTDPHSCDYRTFQDNKNPEQLALTSGEMTIQQ